jgi:collagen type IV alpha-3-binding protein
MDKIEEKPFDLGNGLRTTDFKVNNDRTLLASRFSFKFTFQGEAITFRATTSGVLITLQHCLDIISQKDENFRRKLDKEVERRKKTEEQFR